MEPENDAIPVQPAGAAFLVTLLGLLLAGVAGYGIGEARAPAGVSGEFDWTSFVTVACTAAICAAVAAGSLAIVRALHRH